jgi:hypothetical protein
VHWLLDVEFKDDLSRYRTGHGAKNMTIVRRFALGLVRANKAKGERQDTTQNCRLEPRFPARNPSAQMSVNLDSVPWLLLRRRLRFKPRSAGRIAQACV